MVKMSDITNAHEYNGYKDREDYLKCIAEDYGANLEDVKMMAELLGENEDFDGLIVWLEDL